ncbi:hypothetical protein ACHAWF_009525 [Thalassiosira exigua]
MPSLKKNTARGRGRASGGGAAATAAEPFVVAEDDDVDDDGPSAPAPSQSQFAFSQVDPDQSQLLDAPRVSEVSKLASIPPVQRDRAVTNLARTLLFKGLAGESIDKAKVVAEALEDGLRKERVQNAALAEAEKRLRDVFGFAVRRLPKPMEEDLPARYGNRLYLINDVVDDDHGTHSLNLHSSRGDASSERGVLLMVLAFAFCRGTATHTGSMKGAGKKTRWIAEHHLYGLMHRVDENVPAEPPSAEGKKRGRAGAGGGGGGGGGGSRVSLDPAEGGVGQTPDVDALLERFVARDYLLRDKIEEPEGRESSYAGEDGKVVAYAMGPRAAMEVGRKQIIYFCASVLDETPDPTMLAEVEEDEEESEEEEEEEEEGGEEVQEEEGPKGRKRSKK